MVKTSRYSFIKVVIRDGKIWITSNKGAVVYREFLTTTDYIPTLGVIAESY